MNTALRRVQDGEVRPFLIITSVEPRTVIGPIYWPFALEERWHWDRDNVYDITHLPTGLSVGTTLPKRAAVALLAKLRVTGRPFTQAEGARTKATLRAWKPLVMKARARYPKLNQGAFP